ncbi:DeoR/GlpR family DNA-binding transcription regulator [Lactobacillus sp. ESL0677]|uniref:DeoR/GlpR family DNA-binding transcription regulator n=1 Tax=Lactobacillus sp. ESL0677 TaxID=2983208 RepID=UPI0023F98F58|nr:DeoR/GlpR family DNA-binding transcription regulator [Lactobacillus sp. ESL0677]WEV36110.1 DeoR/GlpR family DNA-binding transcription regulator [Lactobacillus sp. ESL0677]
MKFERLEKIEELLNLSGSVTVKQLSDELGVSKETIRKDLDYLASKRKIGRVHGGAYSFLANKSVPFKARNSMLANIKNNIATSTAKLITNQGNISLFFDSASTSLRVLKVLSATGRKFTGITNSVECLNYALTKPTLDFYTEGGKLNKDNLSFEAQNVNDYAKYSADYAILSPTGIDIKCGITDKDPIVAKTMQVFMQRAKKVYLVADHTKIDSVNTFTVGNLDQIDGIITDKVSNLQNWSITAKKNDFLLKETNSDKQKTN